MTRPASWEVSLLMGAGLALGACTHRPPVPPTSPAVPQELLGEFIDDYGDRFTITATEWAQHSDSSYQVSARYHVARWNAAGQYLIAQNDSANPSARGRWTRIDWLPLPGMAPYTWGFCLSAYDAPDEAAAEATSVARRDIPKTGCNGYPFSRMRRLTAEDH